MNSLQNTVKSLRFLTLRTSFNIVKGLEPVQANTQKPNLASKCKIINFSPRSIGLDIGHKTIGNKIKDPLSYTPISNPRSILPLIETWRKDEIGLPAIEQEEKHAVRLIVIRRKKMKKHQRRKLWKRMRHRWARVRKNRRIKREKLFQQELLALVKQADAFSAEEYVNNKIQKANFTPLPTRWKHKRLPEFIIRQLLGLDKKINYKHTDKYKA